MNEIRTPEKGSVTLPTQAGMEKETLDLATMWGADAVRDSDGTELSQEITQMGFEVYSTLCLVRADQKWNRNHMEQLQQKLLVSDRKTAVGSMLEIRLLDGICEEEFKIDTVHDPKDCWEVVNRTTGAVVDRQHWEYDASRGVVTVTDCEPWHQYTVSFWVFQLWDSVSFYNAITNHWDCESVLPIDPRHPETREHLLAYLDEWLESHPRTDVVRITSVAYNFAVIYNEARQKRYLDWTGYLDCFSPLLLDEFETKKGYRLRLEDLADGGRYNDFNRVPSQQYRDYMEVVEEFVIEFGRECVDRIHRAGKKAMMFFCDHWIGTEPYGEKYASMGFDGIINPCIKGVEARRIAEVPHAVVTEARLYPYFFPTNLAGEPSFVGGGDPTAECREYWMLIRRAMLRKQVDRISWGGYLSLAVQHPNFIAYVGQLCDEFREINAKSQMKPCLTASFKVAVLNAWGGIRKWINEEFAQGGMMESLSGAQFEIEFLDFESIATSGIPSDVKVILNTGEAYSSWSGGKYWIDPRVTAALRKFVHEGGGFVGVGQPGAFEYQGNFFQISDILGVQQEVGLTRCKRARKMDVKPHFITEELDGTPALGITARGVYAEGRDIHVLAKERDDILIASNCYGKGRAVYFAGYQNTPENTRMLARSLFWAASSEAELKVWHSSNCKVECVYYPDAASVAYANSSGQTQETSITDGNGSFWKMVTLKPYEIRWDMEVHA